MLPLVTSFARSAAELAAANPLSLSLPYWAAAASLIDLVHWTHLAAEMPSSEMWAVGCSMVDAAAAFGCSMDNLASDWLP